MNLKENPIGLYEKALPNDLSWEKKFEIAKSLGFSFIELSVDESDFRLSRLNFDKTKIAELNAIKNKYDMEFRSMCLSGHRRFPFGSKDENIRNKAKEIMKKAIYLAKGLGIRNIQLAGYDVYYEESTDESKEFFLEGLLYAVSLAEKENIMLSIEIMDTYFLGTIKRAMRYVDIIKSPYLKIYPDIGNLTQWSEAPLSEIEQYNEHIVAMHLKDTKPGVFKKVEFGEGDVDFLSLFKTLKEIGFSKPFLIEMWAENDGKQTTEEAVNKVRLAKEWLEERMV